MSSRAMRYGRSVWVLASTVVVLLAVAAPANAQATKSTRTKKSQLPATKDEAQAKSPTTPAGGFLGDSKRFTRFGGWGSIGGAIGQFGFARSMLIMMPAVQLELKLTPEQKEQLRLWQEESRERGEEWGRKMREQNGDNGDPFRQNDVPLTARIMQFSTLMSQVSNLAKEGETSLAKILTSDQRKRLNQVALQMEGLSALSRPEIAEALNLDEDQVALIQQTLAQARIMQMTTWVQTGMALGSMRQGPRNGGGPPANAAGPAERAPSDGPARAARSRPQPGRARTKSRPSTPPAEPAAPATTETRSEPRSQDQPQAEAGSGPDGSPRRDRPRASPEQQRQFARQFESMRDRTDRIQEQAVKEISRILTKRQRANFDKMLGPPFDPTKLELMGRPPGRNATPGTPPPRTSNGGAARP